MDRSDIEFLRWLTDLRRILGSLTNEIDQQSVAIRDWDDSDHEKLRGLLVSIADQFYDFDDKDHDLRGRVGIILAVTMLLSEVQSNPIFVEVIGDAEVNVSPERKESLRFLLAAQLADADSRMRRWITEDLAKNGTGLDGDPQPLVEIVPEQGVGPYHFAVEDGVIRIDDQEAIPPDTRAAGAEAARNALLGRAAAILEYLRGSNIDRRMTVEVQQMTELLAGPKNIIALGLASLEFMAAVALMDEELPGVWQGKLQGFAQGVQLLVGQYPEWEEFVEISSQSNMSSRDIKDLYEAGNEVVARLGQPDLASQDVPRAVGQLVDMIKVPEKADKKAAFANLRTLGNLVIAVVRPFVAGAPEGAQEATKSVVKNGLLIAMSILAVKLAPIAAPYVGFAWLAETGAALRKQAGKEEDDKD